MNPQDDHELRAMVRQSIARVLGQPPSDTTATQVPVAVAGHTSHYRYALPESDGPCLIEPAVPCTHCGYCQSHGH